MRAVASVVFSLLCSGCLVVSSDWNPGGGTGDAGNSAEGSTGIGSDGSGADGADADSAGDGPTGDGTTGDGDGTMTGDGDGSSGDGDGSSGDGDGTSGDGDGTSGDGDGDGDGDGTMLSYPVAAMCIDAITLDPTYCANNIAPANSFTVDNYDDDLEEPVYGLLSIPLDGQLVGRTVISAQLRLRSANVISADTPAAPELWEVVPFVLGGTPLLSIPAQVGAVLDPGGWAIGLDEEVVYSVPTGLVAPNQTLWLGLFPISWDAVDLLGSNSSTPPTLELTLAP